MRRFVLTLLALVVTVAAGALAWLNGDIEPYPLPGDLIARRSAGLNTAAACLAHAADRAAYNACLAREAPIASLAEYRRCGGYLESQRVGESRIACSKPELTDVVLKLTGEGRSLYRDARRACRAHDFCYVHAMSTYDPKFGINQARERCDRMLLADGIRDCRLLYPADDWGLRKCQWSAMAAYSAVRLRGHKFFNTLNQATCDYEPGAHAPRDTVVSGRFGKDAPERIVTFLDTGDGSSLDIELVGFDAEGRSRSLATLKGLSPGAVRIADREDACKLAAWTSQGDCATPVTLGQSTFKHWDWLRYPPVVLDADGDGDDEILLVSLTPYLGLVLTEIRIEGSGDAVAFSPPVAFIAFDVWNEFGPGEGAVERPLSSEAAIQLTQNTFVPVRRPTAKCGATPASGPEDIMLLAARANSGKAAIANRLYRFLYEDGRWQMRRDKFNDDHHKLRYCDTEEVGSIDQPTRFQYPSFAVRGPASCDDIKPFTSEALAAIVREKCPSSTLSARAGDLNDIDLLSYNLDPKYPSGTTDSLSWLRMAKVSWVPVIWNEAADPVMTSRAARDHGVLMVSAFAGGTPDNRYPLISVLRTDTRLQDAAKPNWWERQPDTLGATPVQYTLIESDPDADRQRWNSEAWGDPRMMLQLPSVLAPFWTNGNKGLSVIMLANRASYSRQPQARQVEDRERRVEVIPRGHIQILMAPLINASGQGPTRGDPRWLECPVPDKDTLPERPARPTLRWRNDFLHQEPILAGNFFYGPHSGGLAIVYRTDAGRLATLSLRNDAARNAWMLGGGQCRSLTREVNGKKERNVWMMRLN